MATKHTCDRCGKIINNFDVCKHNVMIFTKTGEHVLNISPHGMQYMDKSKYADLCENCQDDLHTVMEAFMDMYNSIITVEITEDNITIF